MKYQDVKIGDTYLLVPSNKDRVSDIDFVRVIEQQNLTVERYIYFAIYNRKSITSCFAENLFDNMDNAISFVRKIAQDERTYDIEYEVKATKKIIDRFKNRDELERRLKNIKKEIFNDALDIYSSGIGLYEHKKDEQFRKKIQERQYLLNEYINWKETNK